MKRIEPAPTAAFRKDATEESFLRQMNAALAGFEEDQYLDLPERLPTLHVIGLPRSGTTLLTQLIAAHLDVGFVNNLVASFWRAPVTGMRLSRKLLAGVRPGSFESRYGRTAAIEEPHEFGYFWFERLAYSEMRVPEPGHGDTIDWDGLRRVLLNLTHVCERPVLFKNFLIAWHMNDMLRVLPSTCFVRVRRDPLENALSLLRMRVEFLGSKESWASMKPLEYDTLRTRPHWEQVAGQVHFLERALDDAVSSVDPARLIEIELDSLCGDPATELRRVATLLRSSGATVGDPDPAPVPLAPRAVDDRGCEDRLRVSRALESFS